MEQRVPIIRGASAGSQRDGLLRILVSAPHEVKDIAEFLRLLGELYSGINEVFAPRQGKPPYDDTAAPRTDDRKGVYGHELQLITADIHSYGTLEVLGDPEKIKTLLEMLTLVLSNSLLLIGLKGRRRRKAISEELELNELLGAKLLALREQGVDDAQLRKARRLLLVNPLAEIVRFVRPR